MNLLRQRGAGLIEVMVAVLISATGVIGAAALQLNSVKFNQSANARSSAVFLANDICDRMRANRANALAGNYDIGLGDSAPGGESISGQDLQEWVQELSNRLPGGQGSISREGTTFTVLIQWDESRMASTREQGEGDDQAFTFITEL